MFNLAKIFLAALLFATKLTTTNILGMSISNPEGNTPLHTAVTENDIAMVKNLLENHEPFYQTFPWHEILKKILRRNIRSQTPLDIATLNNFLEIKKYLETLCKEALARTSRYSEDLQ